MKNISTKIILFLILLVGIVLVFDYYLFNNKNKIDNKEDNNKVEPISAETKILIYNNYLATYILKGNIKTNDGFININGVNYYAVNDDNLKNIKSIQDILNIFNDTFSNDIVSTYINYLSDNNYNNYIYTDNQLFVKKGNNICNELVTYDNNSIKIKSEENDKTLINVGELDITAVKNNDKWYTTSLEFDCK